MLPHKIQNFCNQNNKQQLWISLFCVPCTYLPTYLPTYLHTYLPIYLPTYLPTYVVLLGVCLCLRGWRVWGECVLCTYLPYLPIYLPIYPCFLLKYLMISKINYNTIFFNTNEPIGNHMCVFAIGCVCGVWFCCP